MDKEKTWNVLYLLTIPAMIVFIWMYSIAKQPELTAFDSVIFNIVDSISSEGLLTFAENITIVGSKLIIGGGAFLLLLWVWFMRKNYLGIAILVLGVAGSNFLKNLIKEWVGRERPESAVIIEEEFAFPSGHAMVSICFYVLLAFFIAKEFKSRSAKLMIYASSLLISFVSGMSRIILHVHYPSDVTGGYALGFVWLMFCLYIYRTFAGRFPKKEN
ncbi:undecaprenyl-diphosphatase [Bacillus oleivorans]|uniref:Undecaprenyl-diphosphatase n=1 Tax=Bacillus oleivorans TaxID=1448271 RepID=A0A285CR66_9BACI|nr:phosphatase PAP2 family protein [Bacillus oleivorans]SNX70021.1 undecaprenyl-diphosphatase [Bacillus oleivorans]